MTALSELAQRGFFSPSAHLDYKTAPRPLCASIPKFQSLPNWALRSTNPLFPPYQYRALTGKPFIPQEVLGQNMSPVGIGKDPNFRPIKPWPIKNSGYSHQSKQCLSGEHRTPITYVCSWQYTQNPQLLCSKISHYRSLQWIR